MSIPQPSVRSTQVHHRKVPAFRVIPAEEASDVRSVIDKIVNRDWRITSLIDLNRDYDLLTKDPLWISQRRASNIERSGFLLLRTNGPCIMWNSMKDEMISLRIQIPHGFCNSDTYWLCIATICNSEQSLDIEDVILANGVNVYTTLTYGQRYQIMKSMHEKLVNQPYLGLTIKLIQPIALNDWLNKTNVYGFTPDDGSVWDIQSDIPGKKRKVWISPKKTIEAPKQVSTVVPKALDALVHTKAVPNNHNPLVRNKMPPIARYARIQVDKTGPDRYILLDANNGKLGYALVRGLIESEKYRTSIQGGATVARVEYSEEFSKYKMVELLSIPDKDINTYVSSRELFTEL
jgi:hypothetical protein